jgi:predicted transcriptional regulator
MEAKDEKMGEEISLAKQIYILFQPVRWKIITCLLASERPLYAAEIAEKIGEDRRNVADHLSILEGYGFVKSELREIEKPGSHLGKIGKYYAPTEKIKETIEKIREGLAKV